MAYLITQTEVYRFEREREAVQFLENSKRQGGYEIVASKVELKSRKQKGEVVESWVRLTIKKVYNEELDPLYPYQENDNGGIENG